MEGKMIQKTNTMITLYRKTKKNNKTEEISFTPSLSLLSPPVLLYIYDLYTTTISPSYTNPPKHIYTHSLAASLCIPLIHLFFLEGTAE